MGKSRKFKTIVRALAALGLMATLKVAHADITVGVSIATTGPAASIGKQLQNAMLMWPETIGGQKLRVVMLDDAGDPAIATRNTRRLVTEENADIVVGSAGTPASIAMAQVANETHTVLLSPAPTELPEGQDPWVFRVVMHGDYWANCMVDHLKSQGVRRVAFLGYSDALGEAYLKGFQRHGQQAGVDLVTIERFSRTDTTIMPQVLKTISTKPEAVVVVAAGGGSALPQLALKERRYDGKILYTSASISADFLRVAGKAVEGAYFVSGPEQVPEQLPESHPSKAVAQAFVQAYEEKYGANTRTQFASSMHDIELIMKKVIPMALEKAQPGTPAFREALRDALESTSVVITKGPLKYTASDHWGLDEHACVLLTVKDGDWKLVN